MSDKKTAEEIAKTIPCQCHDCGMRESEATQMIQAYADQELASLREQLVQQKYDNENAWKGVKEVCERNNELKEQLAEEQRTSQRLNDDLANALDVIEKKEEENRELIEEIDKLCSWSGFGDFFPDEAKKLETLIEKHNNNLSA